MDFDQIRGERCPAGAGYFAKKLDLSIACMAEIVGAFLRAELWDERANRSLLEFAVRHLNRIEIRRVLGKVANCRPRSLNRLPNAGTHVDSAVIQHDDVIAPERKRAGLRGRIGLGRWGRGIVLRRCEVAPTRSYGEPIVCWSSNWRSGIRVFRHAASHRLLDR
jgi:hypothetical protein